MDGLMETHMATVSAFLASQMSLFANQAFRRASAPAAAPMGYGSRMRCSRCQAGALGRAS
jgi:hypothetical protein